ncbi:MAG: hypothetical protein NTX36_03640 [Proteobacteria bacterium]|nr:hypothetical protein [Pseudomonadota bacterium]
MQNLDSYYDFLKGFAWPVPSAFLTALKNCNFELGDTFYDSKKAYAGYAWEKLHTLASYTITVILPKHSAMKTSYGNENDNIEKGTFNQNWFSSIKLEIYHLKDNYRKEYIDTTQGRLFTLLWKGDISILYPSINHPFPPISMKEFTKSLKHIKSTLMNFVSTENKEGIIFVFPYDPLNEISEYKLPYLKKILIERLNGKLFEIIPQDKCPLLNKTISPAFILFFFCLPAHKEEDIRSALKPILYKPLKKDGKDNFKLARHGLVFDFNPTNPNIEMKEG